MAVRVYKSTDAGASTLTGQVGKLTDILDACLVNGYNSKTVTITRSGTTATASSTAHGFLNGQRILISGANETDYNGEFTISNVSANAFDYTVANSPATPATGTITAKMAPAGWSISYTGTNKRAYRAATGLRHYYRWEDNNDLAGGANYTRFLGYETMSSIDVGTSPFPTPTQLSGGLNVIKSNTADATARAWIIVASDKFVWLWIDKQGDTGTSAALVNFGEYTALNTYDTNNSIVNGHIAMTTSNSAHQFWTINGSTGTYGLRSIDGRGYSINTLFRKGFAQETSLAGFGYQYPDPISGNIPLAPLSIWEQMLGGDYVPRGYYPGGWALGQSAANFVHGDTFSGKAGTSLSGKTFLILRIYSAAAIAIETSQTW